MFPLCTHLQRFNNIFAMYFQIRMYSKAEHLWSLLPAKSSCFDEQCQNIFNNNTVVLHPHQITEIDAGILVDIASGHVLQIKSHNCDKPWRVLVEYVYPDPVKKTLKIPVITKVKCYIPYGEVLCHVKEIPLNQAYCLIRGKLLYVNAYHICI